MASRDVQSELRHLAHEVRNALNGVAVNLEVARSRAARGVAPDQIAPFLDTAVQQLDAVTQLHQRYTDLATRLTREATSAPGGVTKPAE